MSGAVKVALFFEHGGDIRSTVDEITTQTGVSSSTVRRVITQLVTAGRLQTTTWKRNKTRYRWLSCPFALEQSNLPGVDLNVHSWTVNSEPRARSETLLPSFLPTERKKERKKTSLRSVTRPRVAHKIPEGWQPSAEDRAYAIQNRVDPDLAAQEFYNYWLGEQKAKKDWSLTFRNRVLMLVSWDRFRLPEKQANGRRVSGNGFEEVRAGDGHSYFMEPPVWAGADEEEAQP